MFFKYSSVARSHLFSIIRQMKAVVRSIEFMLFPAFCTSCKDLLLERKALCVDCIKEIKPLVSTKLIITQKYEMEVHAVGAYQEPLRQLVLAKSYQDRLACYYMAQLIFEHTVCKELAADYLVPIPLHWTRYAKRGYNQSVEIANHLSRLTGLPILHALKRVKRTPFQMQFDKEKRKTNVQDAFCLALRKDQYEQVMYKRLILIDDVMTTGATLHAAGRQLLLLKPLSIRAVVFARTS